MKRFSCFLLLCSIILLCASCSIQGTKPESGFWYCEELNTGIDFDLYQTTRYCIIVYHEDGSVQINGCLIDYGTGICFFTDLNDNYNEYFIGSFKYDKKKEQFVITSLSDGNKYVFVRQETTNENVGR